MTSGRNSQQGMGSVSGLCSPFALEKSHWEQTLLWPATCTKTEVVVHQRAGVPTYCFAVEVSDPHTGELLASHVDPSRNFSPVMPLPVQVALTVRAMLLGVYDPDPFDGPSLPAQPAALRRDPRVERE